MNLCFWVAFELWLNYGSSQKFLDQQPFTETGIRAQHANFAELLEFSDAS